MPIFPSNPEGLRRIESQIADLFILREFAIYLTNHCIKDEIRGYYQTYSRKKKHESTERCIHQWHIVPLARLNTRSTGVTAVLPIIFGTCTGFDVLVCEIPPVSPVKLAPTPAP
jgi:hypothetical protein